MRQPIACRWLIVVFEPTRTQVHDLAPSLLTIQADQFRLVFYLEEKLSRIQRDPHT